MHDGTSAFHRHSVRVHAYSLILSRETRERIKLGIPKMQQVAGDLLHLRPHSAAYALHQRDTFFPAQPG